MSEKIKHFDMSEEEFLAHYGVLGMKWGKRKGSSSESSKSGGKGSSGNESDDHKTKKYLQKKRPSEMSTAELKKVNDRLQTEKTYAMLTAKQKSKSRKLFDEIVGGALKSTAKSFLTQKLGASVDSISKDVSKKNKAKNGKLSSPKTDKDTKSVDVEFVKDEDIPKSFR